MTVFRRVELGGGNTVGSEFVTPPRSSLRLVIEGFDTVDLKEAKALLYEVG